VGGRLAGHTMLYARVSPIVAWIRLDSFAEAPASANR
jgi:hypothetical protein